jgi:acyl carrier protein
MEQQLREMIAKIAETTPDFGPEADLREEVGIDSHRAVELLFEIESTFSVRIPPAKFDQLRTLKQTMALIESLKAGG